MKVRALDQNGDYVFGAGSSFLSNSPLAVAQAIMTRLKLSAGEWFLDSLEGTRYRDQILGHGTEATRDLAVRVRILETPGVKQISGYVSFVDETRAFVVIAAVETIYGLAPVYVTF